MANPASTVRIMGACYTMSRRAKPPPGGNKGSPYRVRITAMRRAVLALLLAVPAALAAQQNRIDVVTPSAPELAAYGPNDIGVRTIQVTDKNRPDILNTKEGGATARYDRTLTVEVWYPAALTSAQKPGGDYRAITRDPATTV